MAEWKNLDTLGAYKALMESDHRVDLREVLAGEAGGERVKEYCVPMACGLVYNYASKQVDEEVLSMLKDLAEESDLEGKFRELYNGAMINTGERDLCFTISHADSWVTQSSRTALTREPFIQESRQR